MSLYNKGRHSVALSVQKSMENSRSSFAFEDASLVSLLEHSLVLNNHENVKHLYKISKRYTDDKTLTHSPPLITSTAYRSFISAFSRFNIKDLGQTAFATYVRLRLKEANEHNAKHSLTRTLASVGPSQSKGDWVNSFRAFVPPEPPRNVLSSMASLLGRMQDREQIVPFFKTHVFQPERLATYRIHTTNKARAEIQTAIETTTKEIKLWENCSKEERNATAGHGRYLNRKLASLKEQQKAKRTEWTHITGREGPLAVVYEALRKGWTDALMEGAPNDAHKAANLMDLEAVIQELTDMESQVLDSLP